MEPGKRNRGLLLSVLLLLAATSGFALWQENDDSDDRTVVLHFTAAMTAPRNVYDGRTLEARTEVVIADLAMETHQREVDITSALSRYAAGDWLGRKRTGWNLVLTHMAARHFESAIGAARTMPPTWEVEAFAGALELGRGRIPEAAASLNLAFDGANAANVLDTPEALPLLTAIGTLPLSRRSFAEAEPYLRRAAAVADRFPEIDRRDHARILTHFAHTLAAQGFPEEAEPLCARAVEIAACYARTTGHPDADQKVFEENLRKIVRAREAAR